MKKTINDMGASKQGMCLCEKVCTVEKDFLSSSYHHDIVYHLYIFKSLHFYARFLFLLSSLPLLKEISVNLKYVRTHCTDTKKKFRHYNREDWLPKFLKWNAFRNFCIFYHFREVKTRRLLVLFLAAEKFHALWILLKRHIV